MSLQVISEQPRAGCGQGLTALRRREIFKETRHEGREREEREREGERERESERERERERERKRHNKRVRLLNAERWQMNKIVDDIVIN